MNERLVHPSPACSNQLVSNNYWCNIHQIYQWVVRNCRQSRGINFGSHKVHADDCTGRPNTYLLVRAHGFVKDFLWKRAITALRADKYHNLISCPVYCSHIRIGDMDALSSDPTSELIWFHKVAEGNSNVKLLTLPCQFL